jgi:hypothetical protein
MHSKHAKSLEDKAVAMRKAASGSLLMAGFVSALDSSQGDQFWQDRVVEYAEAAEAYEHGAAAIKLLATERAAIEEAKSAFEQLCRYRWFHSDPDFADRMVDAENECWDETRIPPPGRSVPMDLLAPPDEVRQDNWIAWIKAKRLASLDRLTAAMAKLGGA